jgi:hypothetical protein
VSTELAFFAQMLHNHYKSPSKGFGPLGDIRGVYDGEIALPTRTQLPKVVEREIIL